MLLATACSFDDHRRNQRCQSDEACALDEICTDGLCVMSPSLRMDEGPLPDRVLPEPLDAAPLDAQIVRDAALVRDAEPELDRAVIDAAIPDLAVDLAVPDAAVVLPLPIGQDVPGCASAVQRAACWWPTDDTYADEHDDDRVFALAEQLHVQVARNRRRYTYLRFDLSPLVGHRAPTRCELRLRRTDEAMGDNGRLRLYHVASNWAGANLTWQLRPEALDDLPRTELAANPSDVQAFEVVQWVRTALRVRQAIGFRLEGIPLDENGETFALSFDSDEAGRTHGLGDVVRPYLFCRFDDL
jgi:hypothetical protein